MEAEILTGSDINQVVFISRISMIINKYPYEFKRV